MTVQEFSDSFDTLLNSYASKAIFGDQAGVTEIVLDEYEKSVLLTQAQDNVIKSYFERHTNQLGQGFDDSSRRQVDFSSLIKVATLTPEASTKNFDNRGIIYKLPVSVAEDLKEYSRVLYILNEALIGHTGSNVASFVIGEGSGPTTVMNITISNLSNNILQVSISTDGTTGTATALFTKGNGSTYDSLSISIGVGVQVTAIEAAINNALSGVEGYDDGGTILITVAGSGTPSFEGVTTQARTLMPSSYISKQNEMRYVIIPINYKEYDREMSKPYANPLKKQAWRLFQNVSTGYDIYSELIPIWNVDTTNLVYKIRYVERPTPIIVAELPAPLSIDGYHTVQPCILNPIIHPDILKEAVRLAIESRASAATRAEAYREQEQRQGR